MTHSFPLFVAAGLLLNVTPGPDVLYIVARAARAAAAADVRSRTAVWEFQTARE